MYKFKFADIGEGLHEGVVAEIFKKEGDKVEEGDSLFSVETDKVTSDIPSPVGGVISKVLMAEGDTIHVGDEIYYINDGSGDSVAEEPKAAAPAAPAPKAAQLPVKEKVAEVKTGKIGTSTKLNDGVLTTPFARALAVEKNIDITLVKGTGIGGRVLATDVNSFTPSAKTSSAATSIEGSSSVITSREDKVVKIDGMRRAIAKAMETSWSNVSYTNLVAEVNMTKLWDERKLMIDSVMKRSGVKVTFTAFIMKVTAIALKEFPMFNVQLDQKNNQLIQKGAINLGMATDTEKGLVVPVINNADQKSVVEIAKDIITLATKAREGHLTLKDMSGGTFSVTNYGSVGALHGVPIINWPEIAILGTGAIFDKVFMNANGEVYNGKSMHITLAADHRWVDGGDIGRMLMRVKELLENPSMIGVY
ncbi:MAG: 2-oxo acid dehydrogenase subunit E2 [Mycoplasma sp.]|nr:2-oxo acid dehydrogenase subunit E2 [Mycoplasma sp.]